MSFLNPMAKSKLCMFEIRLDDPFIVFRGAESDTPPTECTGSVVLMTAETIQTKGIRVVLEGKRRTQHIISKPEQHSGLPASSVVTNRSTFLRMAYDVKDGGKPIKTIPPGNHTYYFTFPLAGDTPESIEGMQGNFIVYDIAARLERGFATKDLTSKKHLRIVRTLGPDAMESSVASAVHGVWPEKLKYSFEPASKNWIFGTTIQTDIELTPLLAKLGIERIKFTLKEIKKIRTEPGPEYSTTQHKWVGMWKEEQDVFHDTMELPEGCGDVDLDTQLPMYKFTATWKLPKSLAVCRQTVENNDWIQIKHAAHYDILLRNPDGHLSELKAHHPARLFISPNLPVDDNNTVATSPGEAMTGEPDLLDQSAPPTYGTHQLDQLVPLYQDIDPSGFQTPGLRSGSATPSFSTFASRNASHDNLASLGMIDSTHPNPSALRNRLRNLERTSDETPDGEHGGRPAERNNSFGHTTPTEGQIRDRHHAGIASSPPDGYGLEDYDMNQLGRMPSYNTAVRQNPRTIHAETPPTYIAAVSRPPSPLQPVQPALQMPTAAHLRTSGNTTPQHRRAS